MELIRNPIKNWFSTYFLPNHKLEYKQNCRILYRILNKFSQPQFFTFCWSYLSADSVFFIALSLPDTFSFLSVLTATYQDCSEILTLYYTTFLPRRLTLVTAAPFSFQSSLSDHIPDVCLHAVFLVTCQPLSSVLACGWVLELCQSLHLRRAKDGHYIFLALLSL